MHLKEKQNFNEFVITLKFLYDVGQAQKNVRSLSQIAA